MIKTLLLNDSFLSKTHNKAAYEVQTVNLPWHQTLNSESIDKNFNNSEI